MDIKIAIENALAAHAEWRNRLHDAIDNGTSEFKVDAIKVDNGCTFGKWVYSLPQEEQNSEKCIKVKQLHAEFHRIAAETLDLALSGKKDEANKNMSLGGSFNRASGKLVLALNEWKNSK